MNRTQALQEKPFDTDQWQKLYYRHQQQYIRKRLEAIKLLKQGNSRFQVCQEVRCSYDTLTSWIDKYFNEGLKGLVRVITHHKPGRLNLEQQQQIKAMLLEQRPTDYGIDRQMWTGAILSEVIAQRWQVHLKDSRIYELLEQLGLSSQRAHRDYANANPQAQQQWVETVKKNFSTSNLRRRWCSLTSLPFMSAPVCSMVGQSATLVHRSTVMSAPGTNSTGSCAWTL